jgi:hypothetical protein
LELVHLHIPSPNSYPQSLHVLKQQLGVMGTTSGIQKFCSSCLKEISQQEKCCATCGCRTLSHYICLLFEMRLQEIFSGNLYCYVMVCCIEVLSPCFRQVGRAPVSIHP